MDAGEGEPYRGRRRVSLHPNAIDPYTVGHSAPDALEGGIADPSDDTQLSPFVIPSHVRPAFSALEHHSAAFFTGSAAAVFKEK